MNSPRKVPKNLSESESMATERRESEKHPSGMKIHKEEIVWEHPTPGVSGGIERQKEKKEKKAT